MADNFQIRAYHSSDLYMLYRICLETGADGDDATGQVDDELLGHFFAAPYAVLEPELCFILTRNGETCGYILGTADTEQFASRCQQHWWPMLRQRYPLPDRNDKSRNAAMIRAIHNGYVAPKIVDEYPAHLHIDLLPMGQGAGQGPKMMAHFISELRKRSVPGLHLGVSKANKRAINWYPKFGFSVIEESATGVTYGMRL